ncbi:putative two-component system sensory histidine kinase [Magnetofaba australis IT-1]|uniref:histidine kinase n=1 Tax=Magnetofaba australis IT-1 TaxID=1434232 RepID=A0A1Y2K7S4_9PROT|nr:putative two-component system sensory histidine kinase [Magnetofaba australis IT-1]
MLAMGAILAAAFVAIMLINLSVEGYAAPLLALISALTFTVLAAPILYLTLFRPLAAELETQSWSVGAIRRLNRQLRGLNDDKALCQETLDTLGPLLELNMGVIYLSEPTEDAEQPAQLRLMAGYALDPQIAKQTLIPWGEGAPGAVAKSGRALTLDPLQTPQARIDVGVCKLTPRHVIGLPIARTEEVKGVMILGSGRAFSEATRRFLERACGTLALALTGVDAHARMQGLLDQTRQQKNELSIHQDLLRETIEKLEQSSRYKSRFLASMSHELRSPLNSLLILSKLLGENRKGNLDEKQVEFAHTIHSAGSDLLSLIDEVLDLARIEAGHIRIFKDKASVPELADGLEKLFSHVARNKGLGFKMNLKPDLPEALHTDRQRVEQILKNLISNAIKFTDTGAVTVTLEPTHAPSGLPVDHPFPDIPWVRFSVSDTGIGIPADKLKLIFEPFKQVDDSSSRKYGGTGLGLAISQELATLLSGLLSVQSQEGEGSTFTLLLPVGDLQALRKAEEESAEAQTPHMKDTDVESIRDDRRKLRPTDASVLVIGNEHEPVRDQLEAARAQGFAAVVAGDMGSALFLANFYNPLAAILATPLSGVDESHLYERLCGAVKRDALAVLELAASGAPKLKEDRAAGVWTCPADATAQEREALCCEFLDALALPAAASEQSEPTPSATAEEPAHVTAVHLSTVQPPESKPATLVAATSPTIDEDAILLEGRRILVVEDDMRNIFALTSLLESQGAEVVMAKNGRVGLERLHEDDAIEVVLLDIMMPDMDGYEVLKEIRRDPDYQRLPVIVLTAKALQGERNRCLQAGASDYLPKPIDPPKLLSMLNIWLERRPATTKIDADTVI